MSDASGKTNISEIETLRSEIRRLEELLFGMQSQLDEAYFKNDELSALIAKKNELIDKFALSGTSDSVDCSDLSSPSAFSDISSFVAENSALREQVANFKSVISEMNLKIDELSLENAKFNDFCAQKAVFDPSSSGLGSSDDLRSQIISLTAESALTTRQLHQAQEELQHYFLLSRSQADLLQKHENLEGLTISGLLDYLNC